MKGTFKNNNKQLILCAVSVCVCACLLCKFNKWKWWWWWWCVYVVFSVTISSPNQWTNNQYLLLFLYFSFLLAYLLQSRLLAILLKLKCGSMCVCVLFCRSMPIQWTLLLHFIVLWCTKMKINSKQSIEMCGT